MNESRKLRLLRSLSQKLSKEKLGGHHSVRTSVILFCVLLHISNDADLLAVSILNLWWTVFVLLHETSKNYLLGVACGMKKK